MIAGEYTRGGHERVWMVGKNSTAAIILKGSAVSWDYATLKDGSFILPTTATINMFAGILWENAGTSGNEDDVARILAYGYHNGAYLAGTTVTPGARLVPVNATSYMTLGVTHADSTVEAPDEANVYAIAATTGCLKASSTVGNTYAIFVRALGK